MKMILNGQHADAASGEVFEVLNPATGEAIETVPRAGREDVRRAIEIARCGKPVMAGLPAHRRSDILRKTSELMGPELESLSRLLCSENGKTIRQCRFEMATTQRLFADFAEEAKRIRGEYLPMDNVAGLERMISYTVRQPLGIVVGIVPFNYPAELFAHKIPGAIAAGCSVIVKLPELCPLTVLRIGELMLQAGLPPEGMQMLTGFPRDLGDELLTHPDIRMISFTGSVPAARAIAEKASGSLKRLAFELGGIDPMIVLDDAAIGAAAQAVVQGRLTNGAGQICCAVKRVLVQQTVYEPFMAALVEAAARIRMGDPSSEEMDLGPLITPEAAGKVDRQVRDSIGMGAALVTGGQRVGRSFYQPTILTGVRPEMPVLREEVFGPVVPVTPFREVKDAVRAANDSPFGLQSSVFSENIHNAIRVAHQLEAGGVVINAAGAFRPGNVPFGGVKQSGIGRESIVETVLDMTELKTIVVNEAL
jgi:acyl-CoA reductase-like NAD-dependent aldehyde dehydrogenase